MDKHERLFDKELGDLKKKLLRMAAVAEDHDRPGHQGTGHPRRAGRPGRSPQYEDELNRLQIEIDEAALTLLATQQPVAVDLRFIFARPRSTANWSASATWPSTSPRTCAMLAQQPPLKPLLDIPRMADLARKMVKESLDAFVKEDVTLAQAVIRTDDQVDDLHDQIIRELITYMISDTKSIERALALILIARHLERIADHATNISEDVIYMCQGRDVRHPRRPGNTRRKNRRALSVGRRA